MKIECATIPAAVQQLMQLLQDPAYADRARTMRVTITVVEEDDEVTVTPPTAAAAAAAQASSAPDDHDEQLRHASHLRFEGSTPLPRRTAVVVATTSSGSSRTPSRQTRKRFSSPSSHLVGSSRHYDSVVAPQQDNSVSAAPPPPQPLSVPPPQPTPPNARDELERRWLAVDPFAAASAVSVSDVFETQHPPPVRETRDVLPTRVSSPRREATAVAVVATPGAGIAHSSPGLCRTPSAINRHTAVSPQSGTGDDAADDEGGVDKWHNTVQVQRDAYGIMIPSERLMRLGQRRKNSQTPPRVHRYIHVMNNQEQKQQQHQQKAQLELSATVMPASFDLANHHHHQSRYISPPRPDRMQPPPPLSLTYLPPQSPPVVRQYPAYSTSGGGVDITTTTMAGKDAAVTSAPYERAIRHPLLMGR